MSIKWSPIDLSGCVFLRRQLISDGYDDAHLRALVAAGTLRRIRRGAYVEGVIWDSLSPADRHRAIARAVLMTAHPATVLTHVSAALELGAAVWGIPLDRVHTTRSDGIAGRRHRDWIQHRGTLAEDHVLEVNGVRVSKGARCAVEVSTIAPLEPSLVTANDLLHVGAMTKDEFTRLAHDARYWPNSLVTDLVVHLCDERMESVAETRTDVLCWTQRLPRPTPQVTVKDRHGREFARVDFAWVKHGVFLEFDGRIKYTKYRREDETLDEYLMREKKREEDICQVTGWVCIRIGWSDLAKPEATAERIRRLLESRRPSSA
jgi:very-short-patch-repair endonuclease